MIAWTFLSAFAGAALLLLVPSRNALAARVIALTTSIVGLMFAVVALLSYDRSAGAESFQFVIQKDWIPSAGIGFHIAADGISLVLILLTGIVAVTGVLFSWNIQRSPQRFFSLFLLIIGGAYGVFLSLDLFLFLVFYETVILPKYLLIAGWGSTDKAYAAMKLTLYSILGSALVIVGIIAAFVASGAGSFDLLQLAATNYPPALQAWAFPVLFLGFAILAGILPFHTWAPGGHVAAPTAASMLLAGVVMKLGAYGALRVAMPLFPDGLEQWRVPFGTLAAAGVLWGAGVALVQRDLKFVVGYSSISHMGFVLLGILTLSPLGVAGGVLQMFSHGIIAALLFAVVGRMVYDRVHTRDLDALAGLGLSRALPFVAVVFVIGSVASMGLPGFSGFIAELMVLLGTWTALPWLIIPVGLGIVLTAAFTLKALQKSFFTRTAGTQSASTSYPPSTWPERLGAGLLILVALGVGLFPQPLLELILSGLHSDLMRGLFE